MIKHFTRVFENRMTSVKKTVLKGVERCRVPVAHGCNPSYLGG
jgi:hypothetical protein